MCNCGSISINNGVDGTDGIFGGYSSDWSYDSSSTSAGAPVKGMRLNNSNPSLVTTIYINTTNIHDSLIPAFIDSFNNTITATNYYGTIRVFHKTDNTKFAYYSITGITSPSGTERALAVTYITGSGSFTGGNTLVVSFTANGAKGTAGSNGSNGSNGTNGAAGSNGIYGGYSLAWKFESSTVAGATSGYFRMDNATPGSVTKFYVSTTTSDGVAATNFLSSLSNSGLFGWIKIAKQSDATKFIMAKVTASSVPGAYYTLTATYTNSSSTFTAEDSCFLTFVPGQNISQPFLYKGKLPTIVKDNTNGTLASAIALIPGTTGGDNIILEDTLSTFNTTTGVWTCPSTGYYNISYGINITQSGTALGTGFYLSAITTTTLSPTPASDDITLTGTTMKQVVLNGTMTYYKLTAADQLQLSILNRSSTDITGNANGAGGDANAWFYITIVRVA